MVSPERLILSTMKTALIIFLIPIFAFGGEAEKLSSRARSESLVREKIAHIVLENAPLKEALKTVGKQWEQVHPGESFPIGLTNYEREDFKNYGADPRITLDLKDVSYFEVLQLIGRLIYHDVDFRNGYVQIMQRVGITEDWTTKVYRVDENIIAGLGLKPDSTAKEVQHAFESFGVVFGPGMKAENFDNHRLVVTNHLGEVPKIEGILCLLRTGFKITKPNEGAGRSR